MVDDLSYELGANVWNDGQIVGFCTKDTQSGPAGVGLGQTQPYTDIITIQAGEQYTPASTSQGDAAGKVVTGSNTGKLAYLVSKGTSAALSGNASETMAYHYAINSLSESGTFAAQNAVGQSVKDRAADLLSEAGSNAGPYTIPLSYTKDAGSMSGTVDGIGVKNASGGWMSGYDYTITISGPAASSARGQTDPTDVVMDFQPTLSSQVKQFSITAGEKFQDTVTVGVQDGDTWVRTQGAYVEVLVEGTLYGYEEQVPAESETIPADAEQIGTEALTFTSEGTLSTSGDVTFGGEGIYTWTAEPLGRGEVDLAAVLAWTLDRSPALDGARAAQLPRGPA